MLEIMVYTTSRENMEGLTVYFVCGKCHFCFERKGSVDACPDRGHTFIREAEAEEIAEYQKSREEDERQLQPK